MTKNSSLTVGSKCLQRSVLMVAVLGLSGTVSVASADELVKEFSGRSSTTTAEFKVDAPWVLDWHTRGDYPGRMGFEVTLIKSPLGEYVGKVATTKWVDNGARLFNEGGRYRIQVDSNLIEWNIKIQQLTEAEAEQYTIRKNSLLPD